MALLSTESKSIVSESLRFFIVLLHEQLCDKNCEEKGRYTEVLDLLKFWRLNSKYPDIKLLEFEHNLYTEINDLESIEDIDEYLYSKFPDNEQYILLYLNVLERTNNKEKIKEVSDKIHWKIEDERFGVNVAIVLMRNNVNAKKGFDILFQLASNPNNIIARKNYFTSSPSKIIFNNYDYPPTPPNGVNLPIVVWCNGISITAHLIITDLGYIELKRQDGNNWASGQPFEFRHQATAVYSAVI